MAAKSGTTWRVTAEGPVDSLYRRLKRDFDKKYVPKEDYEFASNPRRYAEPHTKQRIVDVDENQAVQFRRMMKVVQTELLSHAGTRKVTISGNETGASYKIEKVD